MKKASSKKPLPPLLSWQFFWLLCATGSFGLSFSAYFLLPKFLATELNADSATIGAVSAISMFASVLAMPFVGAQVDRHGRRAFGLTGITLFAFASAGFIFVDSVGPFMWMLRLIQGVSFTLFYISLSTLTTDITPPQRMGQAIGLFGAVMISTNALGPAVAEWAADTFGWPTVFSATVVVVAIAGLFTLLVSEHREIRPHDDHTNMFQVLNSPGMKRVLAVALLVGITLGALFTFYQPWALSLGFDTVSSYLVGFAGCAMLVRVGLGAWVDRIGRRQIATAAALVYVCTPLVLLMVDVLGLAFAGALLGISHGLFFPALNALAIDCASEAERGKAMACFHGAFNGGFAAGSYFLGLVALASNYETIFVIAGLTCLIGFLLLATSPRPNRLATS